MHIIEFLLYNLLSDSTHIRFKKVGLLLSNTDFSNDFLIYLLLNIVNTSCFNTVIEIYTLNIIFDEVLVGNIFL